MLSLKLEPNGTIAPRRTFTSITLWWRKTMTRLSVYILAAAGLLAAASGSALPAFAADNMQTAEELRTSKLVGSKVYNNADENIGSIEDIILKPDGSMDEVVLSVGGFPSRSEPPRLPSCSAAWKIVRRPARLAPSLGTIAT